MISKARTPHVNINIMLDLNLITHRLVRQVYFLPPSDLHCRQRGDDGLAILSAITVQSKSIFDRFVGPSRRVWPPSERQYASLHRGRS